MTHGTPYIELRIDLADPPELIDLVGAFAAISNQFEQFIAREYSQYSGNARLFVKDLRHECIVLELIPQISALVVGGMDTLLIVDGFVTRFRSLLSAFIGGNPPPALPRPDVKNYLDTVRLLAKDKNGTARISSAVYRENGPERSIVFEFNNNEAKKAQEALERLTIEHDKPVQELKENVLMVFWQSSRQKTGPDKKTSHKGIIEAVSTKPLAIRFATEMTNEKFIFWINQSDKNLYKIGFYVDCYVDRLAGKPVAYNIFALRDWIDLPDDQD